MKMVKKLLLTVCLGMMALAAGCGDSTTLPTGHVVAAPVVGATVTDANGNVIGTTDASGKFFVRGSGVLTSKGGKYVDANGVQQNAPDLKAPAGASQITPISTLFVKNPAAAQALMTKFGIDLNTDLSVKTAKTAAAMKLNETLGALIQAAGNANVDAVIAAIATALQSNTLDLTDETKLSSFAQNVITAANIPALTANAAVVTQLVNASNAQITKMKENEPLPTTPTTGSTGGTTGGTTLK